MTPFDRSASLTQHESLSLRPRYCLQCSEYGGSCPNQQRRTSGENGASFEEVYKAGNLTVFAGKRGHPDQPVQLDFHFKVGSQDTAHWHGLLRRDALFLDTPHRVLEFSSRESLIATLEYVEEKTEADLVFVNFHKARSDRGNLLRAFGFLGFELVRPDHPALPPWEDVIFMAYHMEREPFQDWEREAPKPGSSLGQHGPKPVDGALEPPRQGT
ncbi:LOW QUALITY PROTEIN: ornithine decarboxylase antizyme 3 [Hemicordylus capensis]|uniref:LOW QUALITY PROTEIN: ornithine decarboxylase antizyme 3 n=1 Tax=Hemicordylus capensis TaxID=884348 RepID=UPI002302A6A4|nr:LOW QUALITY PROTEIN: ornithine decarboxylase antizyme 3 [Hemicordylus capensis]